MTTLLDVRNLSREFRLGGSRHLAVDNVSLTLAEGETLGLIGESGSGKTTLGRMILRLDEPTTGQVLLEGENITALSGRALRQVRRRMQAVFQDPYGSLNPRMKVGAIIAEPLIVHGQEGGRAGRAERVAELLRLVGLHPDHAERYPHEFSGGQRQRIGIARALALSPKLIVADEPVTALDVSIQAQVINLLQDLQERTGIAILFIAHDLGLVRHLCQRVAVMYRGRIVETGPTGEIFGAPHHGYTRALLSAVPVPDPARERARRAERYRPPERIEGRRIDITPEHWILT